MVFINIITNKKREILFEAFTATSFINLYKSHKNIKTVSITTMPSCK